MEYGGITPIGLPEGWRLLVDAPVRRHRRGPDRQRRPPVEAAAPGTDLGRIPGAEVVEGLAR